MPAGPSAEASRGKEAEEDQRTSGSQKGKGKSKRGKTKGKKNQRNTKAYDLQLPCPIREGDPERYEGWTEHCQPGHTYSSITQINEHIKRCHSREYWCTRCKTKLNVKEKNSFKAVINANHRDCEEMKWSEVGFSGYTLMTEEQEYRWRKYPVPKGRRSDHGWGNYEWLWKVLNPQKEMPNLNVRVDQIPCQRNSAPMAPPRADDSSFSSVIYQGIVLEDNNPVSECLSPYDADKGTVAPSATVQPHQLIVTHSRSPAPGINADADAFTDPYSADMTSDQLQRRDHKISRLSVLGPEPLSTPSMTSGTSARDEPDDIETTSTSAPEVHGSHFADALPGYNPQNEDPVYIYQSLDQSLDELYEFVPLAKDSYPPGTGS